MKLLFRVAVLGAVIAGLSAPALAVGPVDIELTGVVWDGNHDFNLADEGGTSFDSIGENELSFAASVWFGKWGVAGAMYSAELEDDVFVGSRRSTDFLSVDVRRRIFEATNGNFLAIGVGWRQIDVDYTDFGDSADMSGFRISAEARISLLGAVQGYAEASMFPSMGDLEGPMGILAEDVEGYHWEAGVMIRVAPFLKLRWGFRHESLDADPGADSAAPWRSWETSGVLVGLTARF